MIIISFQKKNNQYVCGRALRAVRPLPFAVDRKRLGKDHPLLASYNTNAYYSILSPIPYPYYYKSNITNTEKYSEDTCY